MKLPGMAKFNRIKLELDCFMAFTAGCVIGALCGGALIPRWLVLLFLLFAALLKKRPAVVFIAGMVIAFGSGWMNSAAVEARKVEYPDSTAVSGVAVIRDNRATGVDGIVLKSRVRAEFYGSGKNVSCPVLLSLPETIRNTGCIYGDRWQLNGVLTVPQASGFYFDGKDITTEVPPPYGRAYLLEAASAEPLPAEKSLKRGCFMLREVLLRRLTANLDDDCKSMAARLFLGASDGAPFDVKRNFVLAGIIHLFAVSGMHVAVLAGITGMLFIFLPFKLRYLLLAGVTVLYVVSSGMAIPALRAGAMIVTWALLRAFMYHTSNWNILLFSFSMLCIIEPENITDLGTQYSYGITAALIMGLSALNDFYKSGGSVERLMADPVFAAKYRKKRLRSYKIVIFVSVAVLAFAAGAMLTMLHQKYFLPGSIVTNMAAALATPLMFGVFVFKLLAGALWCVPDTACAWLIECGFGYLRGVSELSLEILPPIASGMPGSAAVVIFYLLFFAGLKLKNFYAALAALFSSLVLLCSFPVLSQFRSESLLVLSGSSAHPPLVAYLIPHESRAVVCNVPDSWSGVLGAEELLRHGCLDAELFFSGGRSANNAGIKSFASRINITRINLPEEKPTVWFLRNFEKISTDFPVPETVADKSRQVIPSGDNGFFWHFGTGHDIAVSRMDSNWKIVWKKPDGSTAETVIPFCNHVLVWESEKKPD